MVYFHLYYLIFKKICQISELYEVKAIEIKIPKEVTQHQETIFFGLTLRQFFCSVTAVVLAAGVYLLLFQIIGKEPASWLCILCAAPFAAAGFFSYNGLTLEKFLWVFLKSEVLFAGERKFISENFHYRLLTGKEAGADD